MEFTEKEKLLIFMEARELLRELQDENTYRLLDANPEVADRIEELESTMSSKAWKINQPPV